MELPVIAVIGLGYVGLPLAAAFGKKTRTIGFDINQERINALKNFKDHTNEVSSEELKQAPLLTLDWNESSLKNADVLIVCVPTPVDKFKKPDFTPLIRASELIGRNLKAGATVVYESTVYPGATEDVCIPILEQTSGKKWKKDFFVGYSPERINPGDKQRHVTSIKKVVSGDTPKTLTLVSRVYGSVITGGICEAESIKVAEAAKIIENTQRDINIALINECSMIFSRMGIPTKAVIEAASSKWNFHNYTPGLVGGHCIGVDPFYLAEKAALLGHHPRLIMAARDINDGMAKHVADQTLKMLLRSEHRSKKLNILIMGVTFKENISDIRNSKVFDLIRELKDFQCDCHIFDPEADTKESEHEYGVRLSKWEDIPECQGVVVAVPHKKFKELGLKGIGRKLSPSSCWVDIKGLFTASEVKDLGHHYWTL